MLQDTVAANETHLLRDKRGKLEKTKPETSKLRFQRKTERERKRERESEQRKERERERQREKEPLPFNREIKS